MAGQATERFRALMSAPEERFALDEVCLLIAAHGQPRLDIAAALAELDRLAGDFLPPTLDGLLAHLFGPGGFRGNLQDYYDPRNSYLDQVLRRRVGLPITLSVLAIEVGRRSGVPLSGVAMPGHFLVRDKVDPDVFADPFHGGRLLTAAQCRQMHRALTGGATWDDAYLEPASKRTIVIRVLSNLKVIAEQRSDWTMLSWVMSLRQAIPGVAEAEAGQFRELMARFN